MMIFRLNYNLILLLIVIFSISCSQQSHYEEQESIPINRSVVKAKKLFSDPPIQYKSRPLWFWNGQLSRAQTLKVMTGAREKGYYGLGIIPSHGMIPEYMSPEFMDQYKYAIDLADSLGMKMCLYDEFYFPSGMAGGNLAKLYPQALSKRLDKVEFMFRGPGNFRHIIQKGKFMGAVAMETSSLERIEIDLAGHIDLGRINTMLPEGEWRVMIFLLNIDPSTGRNHCDYLDPLAVEKFIELTYEKYYSALPEHFGTTIDFAFYDEPCLRWVEEGRSWTGSYNQKFKKKYGFSPVELYPAMWYDIGPDTRSARNMLYGFRAELFASGFAGTINKWCAEHNIQLTGHVDQEEILNPVSICGDLLKSFKYQDIPCVDQIAHYGRASKIYKLVSSSAHNFNKTLVSTETYGAIRNMPVENLYKEAMDQFSKGINLMEPHAVWYNDKIDIPPDLSPAGEKFGPHLEEYNQYIGRLQLLLQGGQHVADIGVLYPIASLQADYSFQAGDPGLGGKTSYEADYLDVGEMLSLDIRNDFTYIHPEILDDNCELVGSELSFQNNSESSRYSSIILPGSKTIKWSNLSKIKQFYDNGGVVIATTVLPEYSAEGGHDSDVQNAVSEMFGVDAIKSDALCRASASSIWNTGGFLPSYLIDGNPESSWRPSRGFLEKEWVEIDFGREIVTEQINIQREESMEYSFGKGWAAKEEDQSFSISLLVEKDEEWIEYGEYDIAERNKSMFFDAVKISGIRLIIESGKLDKVSVSEINVIGENGSIVDLNSQSFTSSGNDNGGKAYFIPAPNSEILREVLNDAGKVWDIRTQKYDDLSRGNLTCVHRKMEGRDIYFFANSSDDQLQIPVLLKGKMKLRKWDPHTGVINKQAVEIISENGSDFTSINFSLDPVKSVFFISE